MAAAERAVWCKALPIDAAETALRADGIPASRMVPAYATLDDPQLRARGFFETVEHPVTGEHEYPTWPIRFSAGPDRYWTRPPPMLGEHTEAVLRDELGCTEDDLARLREKNVIGTEPVFG
jgi:crotonobetainyl-CoA:carnitine CoA-transferase CaiB-like acyl-CoA transferase